MIANMAWRNIWRNKRRTILSIAIMAFSTAVLLTLTTIIDGFNEQIIESSVTTYTGYIQVNRKGFWGNESLEGYIQDPAVIMEKIRKLPYVKAITTRILAGGLLSHEDDSVGCILIGIDPEQERNVTIFYRGVEQQGKGRFLKAQDHEESVPVFLELNHIRDFVGLANKLQEAMDPFTKYLKSQISPEVRDSLDRYDEFSVTPDSRELEKLQLSLLSELNRLIRDQCLYQPNLLTGIALSPVTQKHLADVSDKEKWPRLNRQILEDVFATEILKIYAIIIGKDMAQRLSVSLDDYLTVVSQNLGGSMDAAIFQIVGIFDVGNPDFNKNMAMIPQHIAADLVGYGRDKVSQLVVSLQYNKYLDTAVDAVKKDLETLRTFRKDDSSASLLLTMREVNILGLIFRLQSSQSESGFDEFEGALEREGGSQGEFKKDASTVDKYLWQRLSPQTQELVKNCEYLSTISKELENKLLSDLNRIIGDASFSKGLDTKELAKDPMIGELLKQDIKGNDILRMNRLIMARLYPDEIRPIEIAAMTIKQLDEGFLQDSYVKSKEGIELEEKFETLSWRTLLADVVQFTQIQEALTGMISTMVLLAVFIIIFNVITMSVMERKREFGIMKAIGVQPKQHVYLIFVESIMMASVSVAIGCFVGFAACMYLHFMPADLETVMSVFKTGILKPKIKPVFTPNCLMAPSTVLFTALIGPIIPVWKIIKMSPVEALRSV